MLRVRADVTAAQLRARVRRLGFTLGRRLPHTRLFVVRTNGSTPDAAVASLRKASGVATASPDYVRHAFELPNDPFFASSEPYLETIRMQQAWDRSHGSRTVPIAVVDTGVGPALDLDTQLLPGRNFVTPGTDARDDTAIGHGTLVAGIAAAATNNGVGIAGVGWDTTVMPVKVLNAQGAGMDSQLVSGIVWAVDNGASVVNLSLGGPGPGGALCDAVDYAVSKGAVVVAAAGNTGRGTPMYPAACPGVLAVSATDVNGDFAYFSNYGPWIGLAAPGIQITSTRKGTQYGTESGTSFSAPIVSGVAALVRAQHPDWSPTRVVFQLLQTAQDRGPAGPDPYYGSGLLDAAAALGAAAQAPAVPSLDPLEPNNAAAEATELSLTAAASATISPEGDVDWYAVHTRWPGKLAFRVIPQAFNAYFGPNMKPAVEIYDADLNLLARSGDFAYGEREIVVARVPAGRYFLRVANDGGARSAGTYAVAATVHRADDLRKVQFPS